MRKVLHVFKCIVLLVYLLALVLCCHSCIMTLFNNGLGASGVSGDPAASASAPAPVSVPVEQPKDENSVALSSGVYQKDIDTLTAVVNTSDLALLDSFPMLRTADFTGSNCYEEILSWANTHPNVNVRYAVTLPDGQMILNDSTSLDLSAMDPSLIPQTAPLLRYLPNLQTVELGVAQGGAAISADTLASLAAACSSSPLGSRAESRS